MSIIPYAGVFWAIVVGLPIGIAATVVLLMRFRARVAASMRETARKGSARLTVGESTGIGVRTLPTEAQSKAELIFDFARPEEALAGVPAIGLAASAKRQAWRIALVYAAAASAFALIMVITLRFVSPFNPSQRVLLLHFLYFASFFWVFATPAVLAATYAMRKQVRSLIMAVFGLLAVVLL